MHDFWDYVPYFDGSRSISVAKTLTKNYVKNIKKEFIKSALNVKDFLLNHYNIEENKINISEDPKYSFIYHVNKEKLNNIKIDNPNELFPEAHSAFSIYVNNSKKESDESFFFPPSRIAKSSYTYP